MSNKRAIMIISLCVAIVVGLIHYRYWREFGFIWVWYSFSAVYIFLSWVLWEDADLNNLKSNNTEQHINEEEVLDAIVELANTCIEWDFEEFDYSYFIKHLNEKYIIIKRL